MGIGRLNTNVNIALGFTSIILAFVVPVNSEYNPIGLAIEIYFIILLFFRNLKNQCERRLAIDFFLMFIFRMCLLLYQSTHGDLPMAGADSWVFHNNAVNILSYAKNIKDILIPSALLENRGDFFERFIAVIYYFFGESTIYIYYWSFLCSEVVCLLIYKCAYLLTKNKYVSARSSILFYIWPMEIIYSVAYLREMTVQLVFTFSLLALLKYIKYKNKKFFIAAIIWGFIAAGIHSGMVAVVIGYLIIYSLYNVKEQKIEMTMSKLTLFAILMLFIIVSPVWSVMTARFNKIDGMASLIASTGTVIGNTDYIGEAHNSLQLILQMPIRFIYFVLAPLPWHIRSSGTLLAFLLDGIFRIYIVKRIYLNYKKLKYSSEKKYNLFIINLIVYVMVMFIFSWGTNNYGTAMRHRLKIFSLEILLGYTIVNSSSENKNEKLKEREDRNGQ